MQLNRTYMTKYSHASRRPCYEKSKWQTRSEVRGFVRSTQGRKSIYSARMHWSPLQSSSSVRSVLPLLNQFTPLESSIQSILSYSKLHTWVSVYNVYYMYTMNGLKGFYKTLTDNPKALACVVGGNWLRRDQKKQQKHFLRRSDMAGCQKLGLKQFSRDCLSDFWKPTGRMLSLPQSNCSAAVWVGSRQNTTVGQLKYALNQGLLRLKFRKIGELWKYGCLWSINKYM